MRALLIVLKRLGYVLSWLLLLALLGDGFFGWTQLSHLIELAYSIHPLATGGMVVVVLLVIGLALSGIYACFKRKCTHCGGSGLIPAGAWTDIHEANDCPHCKGSGKEPR